VVAPYDDLCVIAMSPTTTRAAAQTKGVEFDDRGEHQTSTARTAPWRWVAANSVVARPAATMAITT
jgi:hypothetical protein